MKTFTTAALALSMVALSAGAVFAQNTMSTGAMSKPMTASQTKMMNKCKAMDHDAMMKNKSCMSMMTAHPDMMSGDSMMKK